MAINLNKFDFLKTARINALVQTLASRLEVEAPLTFLNRTPIVPVASDAEILGSFSGTIFAADIITDDAEAVVVEAGRLEMTGSVSSVPNIKLGARVSQSMMGKLAQLAQGITLQGDAELITGWENRLVNNLITGVRQTQNYLCAAMWLDGLVYDRLGVKISTGFGTPSVLKQTLVGSRRWSTDSGATANVAGMKPIEDLQYMVQNVGTSADIGYVYNRVTMATNTFQFIIASDEFAERVRLLLQLEPDQFSMNIYDIENMKTLFTRVTGLQLELEDGTFNARNTNGTRTNQRVLPFNKVLISNSNDDGNSNVYDFANAIVDESIAASIIAGAPDIGGPQFGPIGYYVGNQRLDPPDYSAYAVAKGFPRKHEKNAVAVITVW